MQRFLLLAVWIFPFSAPEVQAESVGALVKTIHRQADSGNGLRAQQVLSYANSVSFAAQRGEFENSHKFAKARKLIDAYNTLLGLQQAMRDKDGEGWAVARERVSDAMAEISAAFESFREPTEKRPFDQIAREWARAHNLDIYSWAQLDCR